MNKKVLGLIVALLFVFGLVACTDLTTTTTTTEGTSSSSTTTTTTTSGSTTTTTTTTTESTTTTTTTATPFTLTLSGLDDAGFGEVKIIAGDYFDLLAGVTAIGSDSVDYANQILFTSEDAACQIEDGKLMSVSAKVCIVTYTVIVNSKLVRANRNIKISAAPIVMEFVETDKFDNTTILGTNYEVTTTQGADNTFYYWSANAGVLGETGTIEVLDGKLVIDQETNGGVNYGLQTMMLTDIAIEAKRYYKITFTLTSEVDRFIDIVTKAPNNNYGLDTHSIIDVKAGTFEYEMVFVANQALLHLNIMTGAVEGTETVGRLEFSNFVIHEGPIVYEYTELVDFFKNDAIALGTDILPIPTGGTDADFVRQFYYWMNDGEIAAEYVEGGIELVITTPTNVDYGIQLQYNDMTKAHYTMKTGAHYKLTMKVTATTARTMEVNVTGDHYSKPTSFSQRIELNVGENIIEVEFESLYNYYFMKLNFGNYGDLEQAGTFTITDMKLFEDVNATVVEQVELTGNKFPVENANGTVGTEAKQYNFYYWNGEGSVLTATATDGEIAFDIENVGNQFWAIQAKYSGTLMTQYVDYELYFEVYSEVARKIQFEVKNSGFNAVYFAREVQLQPGLNRISYVYFNEVDTFNLQINIGKFGEANVDAGELVFKNFVLTVPTAEVVDFVDNGDFATEQVFGAADAIGWAYWTTEGIANTPGNEWAQPNYNGTAVIASGVLTSTTTQKGGAVWASQIQYNHATETMTVGQVYRVELDVNSNVATTVVFELKGPTNDKNIDTYVDLAVGDNHVVLYYVASQTTFKFFIMPGMTEPGTILVIDNLQVFEPAPSAPLAELQNRFGTPANVNASAIETDDQRYQFFHWTDGAANWTGTYTDGHALVDIVSAGNEFWHIQLKYRGSLLSIGHEYVLSFHVNSEVARKINVQIKDGGFGAQTISQDVMLVAGDNHVEVEFTATFATLNIQFNLGNFAYEGETVEAPVNEAGLLDFSDFKVVTANLVEVVDFIDNGDFATDATFAVADAPGWAYWSTEGIANTPGNEWAQPNYNGTTVIAGGVMTNTTTQTGGAVWACQIQYNHPTATLTVGDIIRVELDINASVATTIILELKGPSNDLNIDIPVNLLQGDNHVIVEYIASQTTFRFFIMPGMVAPGTVLIIDNLQLFVPEVVVE